MAERKCYAIGTGRIDPWRKASREAVKYIKSLEGFQGVHILPDLKNLWIFDTENNAKRAKNNMESKGIQCGKNIGEIYVDENYLNRG